VDGIQSKIDDLRSHQETTRVTNSEFWVTLGAKLVPIFAPTWASVKHLDWHEMTEYITITLFWLRRLTISWIQLQLPLTGRILGDVVRFLHGHSKEQSKHVADIPMLLPVKCCCSILSI
jgi:hypothetical protein